MCLFIYLVLELQSKKYIKEPLAVRAVKVERKMEAHIQAQRRNTENCKTGIYEIHYVFMCVVPNII